jgi:spore germination cell wall hydrolase CwlJ-like protein
MKQGDILLLGAGGMALAAWFVARGGKMPFDLDLSGAGQVSQQVDIVARTIWGEARGEGARGMQAVANVIINRAKKPGWWGHNIIEVCLADRQFSAWNRNDPNYAKVQAVTTADSSFKTALGIAAQAVAGTLPDITGGATSYHTTAINPYWAEADKLLTTIGAHKFYAI